MFGLNKVLPKHFAKVSECFSLVTKIAGQRTLFAPSYFGIDKFTAHLERTQHAQGNNKVNIKSIIEQAVQGTENQIFSEDLKLMLYLTTTKSEFNLVVDAIRKYCVQTNENTYFNFGSPLMKLAYTMNETDKMFDLFLNDSSKAFTENKASAILMNKLFEEKRYNDCITLFRKLWASNKGKTVERQDGTIRPAFSFNTVILQLSEALMEKNDTEALQVAKEIFGDLDANNVSYNKNTSAVLFLLANELGDFEYGNQVLKRLETVTPEIFGNLQSLHVAMYRNLQIINQCNLGKYKEATEMASEILSSTHSSKFFETTIIKLKECAKKSDDKALVESLEDVIGTVGAQKSLEKKTLKEFFANLQFMSPADIRKQKEKGESEFGGSFRPRESNNRESRQFGSGAFNSPRSPRRTNDRFE